MCPTNEDPRRLIMPKSPSLCQRLHFAILPGNTGLPGKCPEKAARWGNVFNTHNVAFSFNYFVDHQNGYLWGAFDSFHIQQRRFIRIIAGFSFQFLLFSQFWRVGQIQYWFCALVLPAMILPCRLPTSWDPQWDPNNLCLASSFWEKQLVVIQYLVFSKLSFTQMKFSVLSSFSCVKPGSAKTIAFVKIL